MILSRPSDHKPFAVLCALLLAGLACNLPGVAPPQPALDQQAAAQTEEARALQLLTEQAGDQAAAQTAEAEAVRAAEQEADQAAAQTAEAAAIQSATEQAAERAAAQTAEAQAGAAGPTSTPAPGQPTATAQSAQPTRTTPPQPTATSAPPQPTATPLPTATPQPTATSPPPPPTATPIPPTPTPALVTVTGYAEITNFSYMEEGFDLAGDGSGWMYFDADPVPVIGQLWASRTNFAFWGTSPPTYDDCYWVPLYGALEITLGHYYCYRTGNGDPGYLRVDRLEQIPGEISYWVLGITYTTWKQP